MLEKLTFDITSNDGKQRHEVQGYLLTDHFAACASSLTKSEDGWKKKEYVHQYHHRGKLYSLIHLASGCRVCFCANIARAVKIAQLLERGDLDWDFLNFNEIKGERRNQFNRAVRCLLFTHLIPSLGEGFPPHDAQLTAEERATFPPKCDYPFVVWHDERRINRVLP